MILYQGQRTTVAVSEFTVLTVEDETFLNEYVDCLD